MADHHSASHMANQALATRAMHVDDSLNTGVDVAPAMHVATTFRYSNDPNKLMPVGDEELSTDTVRGQDPTYIYSRLSAPNTTRFEAILSSLLDARAITYSSGLSAFHAMLVFFNPRRLVIGDGYHGCHGVVRIMQKLTNLQTIDLHSDDATWDAAGLGEGDIVHVETPLNPTGEAYDLASFAARAHKRGAILSVDATFGPPPLQNPFKQGADVVMHSGTKYFGGHSDMLSGVLAVQRKDWWDGLFAERLYLGSVMGSFEGWLGVRSLRTLELRVQRSSESASKLVAWLNGALQDGGEHADIIASVASRVQHASLQAESSPWLAAQMPNGYGPVFALTMRSQEFAKRLPSKLALFHHATSLGGVESLIEWRRMSDDKIDPCLMRVSVGIEAFEDLKEDFRRAFEELAKEVR